MLPYREDLSHSLEENGFTAFINYKEGFFYYCFSDESVWYCARLLHGG